jgi:hypothetical protein
MKRLRTLNMLPIRGPPGGGGGGDGGGGGAARCVLVPLGTGAGGEPRRVVVGGVAIASRIVGASDGL